MNKQTAKQFLQTLGRVERTTTTAAFALLIATIFLDVFSRELTGVGLHWARQAGVYANIIVVMFGLGLASAGGNHLRPRFADNWLPTRWNPVIVRLQDGLMSAFCLFAGGAGALADLGVGTVRRTLDTAPGAGVADYAGDSAGLFPGRDTPRHLCLLSRVISPGPVEYLISGFSPHNAYPRFVTIPDRSYQFYGDGF